MRVTLPSPISYFLYGLSFAWIEDIFDQPANIGGGNFCLLVIKVGMQQDLRIICEILAWQSTEAKSEFHQSWHSATTVQRASSWHGLPSPFSYLFMPRQSISPTLKKLKFMHDVVLNIFRKPVFVRNPLEIVVFRSISMKSCEQLKGKSWQFRYKGQHSSFPLE